MRRKVISVMVLLFALVTSTAVCILFFTEQSLQMLLELQARAQKHLLWDRDAEIQAERCLDFGGAECDLTREKLKKRLAFVAARRELAKPKPDQRILRELLAEAEVEEGEVRRAEFAGWLAQILTSPRFAKFGAPFYKDAFDLLALNEQARNERGKPEPDRASLDSIRRALRARLANADVDAKHYLTELTNTAFSLRRMMYIVVCGMTLAMLVTAAWISNRLLRALEIQDRQLRQRDESYRLAVEAANLGHWEWDLGEHRLVPDERCRSILSQTPETSGFFPDFFELAHPDDRKAIEDALTAAERGLKFNVEHRVLWPDGAEHWVHLAGRLAEPNERTSRIIGVVQDVTARNHAERALRESEARYRRVVQNTSAVILRVDPQAIIRFANDRALEFFGYSQEELIGRHAVGTIVPERESNGRDLAAMVSEIVKDPDHFHSNSNENMRKNGERVWMEWTNSGIYDQQGRLTEFLSVGIDATERRKAEEALRASEKKYRNLFETIQEMVTVYEVERDERGRIVERRLRDANRAFLLAVGASSVDEIRGRTSSELFGKGWWSESHLAAVQKTMDTGQVQVQEVDRPEIDRHYITSMVRLNTDTYLDTAWDITERKRAEQALRHSDERFNLSMEATNDGLWDWNAETDEVYYSPSYYRILGFEPGAFPGTLQAWKGLVHPEDLESTMQTNMDCVAGRCESFVVEYRMKARDGQWRWILCRAKCITRDAKGRALRLIGTHVDITERKRIEEALRKSRDELDLRVQERTAELAAANRELSAEITVRQQAEIEIARRNALSQALGTVFREALSAESEETLCRKCLAIVERVTGSKFGVIGKLNADGRLDAIVGASGWDACRKPATQGTDLLKNIEVRGLCDSIIRKGQPALINDLRNHADSVGLPHGHPELTCFLGVPLNQGNKTVGMIGVANKGAGYVPSDRENLEALSAAIVEALMRRRAEDSVKRERQRLFDVLESLPAMICLLTPDYHVAFANRGFRERFGESNGRLCYEYCFGRTQPCDFCESYTALRTGKPHHWEVTAPDCTVIDVHDFPFTDVDGSPMILEMDMDITERKLAEAKIRDLNATLERRVAERTAELEGANKELEAFAYSVAHDLRAPLRAMSGFSELLIQDHAAQLNTEGAEYLTRVHRGSRQMASLIDGLLELSRTTRTELVRTTVDLTAMAQAIAAELRKSRPGPQVEFVVRPEMLVHADANLLRLVMQNLLENAWKFTSKHPRARIEVGRTGHSDEFTYFVRDDGAGFEMAYVDRLFGTFKRLHPVAQFEGTGIGLTTVQRIIHRHGGKIWAEAEVEKGATFFFTLPDHLR